MTTLQYRADSKVCKAAVHAGLVNNNKGGCAMVRMAGYQSNFSSTTSNMVKSGLQPDEGLIFQKTLINQKLPFVFQLIARICCYRFKVFFTISLTSTTKKLVDEMAYSFLKSFEMKECEKDIMCPNYQVRTSGVKSHKFSCTVYILRMSMKYNLIIGIAVWNSE